MPNHARSIVVCDDITFSWPDGTEVLYDISVAFGPRRTGLVGANGAGKTTLLKLIAGLYSPTSGSITVSGSVGYLPQHLTLETHKTVADLLGIRTQIDALAAIESGDVDPRHFDAIGQDWDIAARARAALDDMGLIDIDLARTVGTLSGGESILIALAGLQLGDHDVLLLDEPTNNLDRETRASLYETISRWSGTLIIVSHDVTLLDLMDNTAELHTGSLTTFGGNYSAYMDYRQQEQAALEQALRTAEQNLKTEKRQRIEAETKLSRRKRFGNKAFENKREPKMIMNLRKQQAQVSAGKLRDEADTKVTVAREEVHELSEKVRTDKHIRINLPDPEVHNLRRLVEFQQPDARPIIIQGSERVAITGRNGIGKTRLIERLLGNNHSETNVIAATSYTDRIGYLPQRLDHLDDEVTVLDAVRMAAPLAKLEHIRAQLARFLFRADTVQQKIGKLSGGERFRVALALLLLAEPPNELLILDEPTNNLDLKTIQEFIEALNTYEGALIVVSHDDVFLRQINIDTWLHLDADGLQRGDGPSGS